MSQALIQFELDEDFSEVLKQMPRRTNDEADRLPEFEMPGPCAFDRTLIPRNPEKEGEEHGEDTPAGAEFGCELNPIPDEDHACYI